MRAYVIHYHCIIDHISAIQAFLLFSKKGSDCFHRFTMSIQERGKTRIAVVFVCRSTWSNRALSEDWGKGQRLLNRSHSSCGVIEGRALWGSGGYSPMNFATGWLSMDIAAAGLEPNAFIVHGKLRKQNLVHFLARRTFIVLLGIWHILSKTTLQSISGAAVNLSKHMEIHTKLFFIHNFFYPHSIWLAHSTCFLQSLSEDLAVFWIIQVFTWRDLSGMWSNISTHVCDHM